MWSRIPIMDASFDQTLDDFGSRCSLLFRASYNTSECNAKANAMFVFVCTTNSCYSACQLVKCRHYIYIFTYFGFDTQISIYIDIEVNHMSYHQRA
jgi:hypothetical protein